MNLIELANQNHERFGEITSLYYNDVPYTNVQIRDAVLEFSGFLFSALIDVRRPQGMVCRGSL